MDHSWKKRLEDPPRQAANHALEFAPKGFRPAKQLRVAEIDNACDKMDLTQLNSREITLRATRKEEHVQLFAEQAASLRKKRMDNSKIFRLPLCK